MAYPFRDSATAFCSQIQPIRDLARTDDPFDPEFAGRLPSGRAYAFDSIKDRVCNYRSPNAKQKLRSADALLIGERDSELWYYFVDFKNQKADNIQSVKDPGRNELLQKAFDSLSILALTFGHAVPMCELQRHASFIVVYPCQDYSIGFLETLNKCSCNQPLWNLDILTKNGFYAEVKTVHDASFATMPLPYLA